MLSLVVEDSDLSIFNDFCIPKTTPTDLTIRNTKFIYNYIDSKIWNSIKADSSLKFSAYNALQPKQGDKFYVVDKGLVVFTPVGWRKDVFAINMNNITNIDAADLPTAINLVNEIKVKMDILINELSDLKA